MSGRNKEATKEEGTHIELTFYTCVEIAVLLLQI